jgi:cysteine-rich repeat protein
VQAGFGEGLEDMGKALWGEITGKGIPDGKFKLPSAKEFNEIGTNTSAREFILNILNFVLSFLGIVAVAMIIYAGFLYVTASGDEGQSEKGKNIILYAVIGIFVILISYALVNTIIRQAGKGGDDRNVCGNAILEIGEECDDGNLTSGDRCSKDCLIESGGSGDVQGDPKQNANQSILPSNPLIFLEKKTDKKIPLLGTQGVWAPLSTAQSGIKFSFGNAGVEEVILNFGDSTSVAWEKGDSDITHQYGTEKTYQVSFVAKTVNGEVISGTKQLIVGGLKAQFRLPSPIVAEQEITLDGSASQSKIGSIVAYKWTCSPSSNGSGCFSDENGKQPSVTFSTAGNYQITLTVTNNMGMAVSDTQDVSVHAATPTAGAISCESVGGNLNPAKYECTASGSTNIFGGSTGLTYMWDFSGETKTTSTPTVTHTFDSPASQTITLTVSQTFQGKKLSSPKKEETLSKVKTLGVDFKIPATPLKIGQDFTFQAQSDGAETYTWEFCEAVALSSSSPWLHSSEIKTYFEKPGECDVTLTVKKGNGEDNSITKKIYIYELRNFQAIPVIMVNGEEETITGSPITIARNDNISLTSKSIDEYGQQSPSDNMTETWKLDNDVRNISEIPSLLTEIKTYPISLKVSRPGNPDVENTTSFGIVIENALPEIKEITLGDPNNLQQNTVSVEASDPDGEIVSYRFELLGGNASVQSIETSDTTCDTTCDTTFDLTNQPEGTYTFEYKVTVTDNDGGTASLGSGPFTVTIPESNNTAPKIIEEIQISSSSALTIGTEVTFSTRIKDDDGDALSCTWDFGDWNEQTDQIQNTSSSPSLSAAHTYSEVGDYMITLTCSDMTEEAQKSIGVTVSE